VVSDEANGWPAPGTRYEPHEIEAFRAQAKRGHADAKAELERRGVGLHPRVAALKAAGKWPEVEPQDPTGGTENGDGR
jgi:hypothetical protein